MPLETYKKGFEKREKERYIESKERGKECRDEAQVHIDGVVYTPSPYVPFIMKAGSHLHFLYSGI